MIARRRIRVSGTVQGVGFRPFVYRIATEAGLSGWVLNDDRGVLLEIEGPTDELARFHDRIRDERPPLAIIDGLEAQEIAVAGDSGFAIRASRHSGDADAVVAPDTATCPDCLAELLDPADRRYRYPFINCTNCGPRLTIVEGVPYDRARTTMASFVMCPACRAEYEDPANRRFHAQPNACPECGPAARLVGRGGVPLSATEIEELIASAGLSAPARIGPRDRDAISDAARLLAAERILAIKGLGGYHLACDARSEQAVHELRTRKHRERKPFAVMVADLTAAEQIATLDDDAAALLTSHERPITLVERRSDLTAAVAPGLTEVGMMLAHTPLHHLLLHDLGRPGGPPPVLVMTSANSSEEPIAHDDADAFERLDGIADAFLAHNRPIRTRVDDSVVRPLQLTDGRSAPGTPAAGGQMLRRSRGYAPSPLALPVPLPCAALATGADLKNTFALGRTRRAWVSHHIGDLENYACLRSYQDGITRYEQLFEVSPELIIHDLHPGYASTRYATERSESDELPILAVQHHHAHLAACLAEHRCDPDREVIGVIYDGTGYGTDGTIWGGEILIGTMARFERYAALLPVAMPGGSAAIREPWRMAASWLQAAGIPPPATITRGAGAGRIEAVMKVAADPRLSPTTSSMGRLLDAIAALCGVGQRISYEGQAAIEFEACIGGAPVAAGAHEYEIPLVAGEDDEVPWRLDPRPLLRALVDELADGAGAPQDGRRAVIASGVHSAVSDATVAACVRAATERGLDTVVLSGGVFLNRALLGPTAAALTAQGLRVLTPHLLPPGDGGIAFGQLAVATALGQT